eukprot:3474737-Amphidinium_carterae.1
MGRSHWKCHSTPFSSHDCPPFHAGSRHILLTNLECSDATSMKYLGFMLKVCNDTFWTRTQHRKPNQGSALLLANCCYCNAHVEHWKSSDPRHIAATKASSNFVEFLE